MQRWFLPGCAAVFFPLILSIARGDDLPPPPDIPSLVQRLIVRLDDPDPSVRRDIQQRLINLGDSARPALRQAIAGASLQARSEIDRILLHIPWIHEDDKDDVKHEFISYADLDAEARCDRMANWGQAAQPVLLRILCCDPSPAVRWCAAKGLLSVDPSTIGVDDSAGKKLIDMVNGQLVWPQAYMPANDNAPLLAIAGWMLQNVDVKRSAELMERAERMEAEHPSAFRGQMDFVYLWLSDRAEQAKDYPRMIELLRRRAERSVWDPYTAPDTITRLFAAEAEHGPTPEFREDVRTYQEYFTHPEMVYCIGQMLKKQGGSRAGAAVNAMAFSMSGVSVYDHLMAGSFLNQHQWANAAERELNLCLRLPGGKTPEVYFELVQLAEVRDDDLAAAQYTETCLRLLRDTNNKLFFRYGGAWSLWSTDRQWAQVHVHYLRAFMQANDKVQMKVHLDKLLEMDRNQHLLDSEPGAGMAADVVPALQDLGRDDQAEQIFNAAYASLKQQIEAAPDDPTPKNNLAWLCACSNKRLDEAVKYAGQAVALRPSESAYLDTQAESYMRIGQPQHAAEIEAAALAEKPDDVSMKKQLERFTAAAARASHASHP